MRKYINREMGKFYVHYNEHVKNFVLHMVEKRGDHYIEHMIVQSKKDKIDDVTAEAKTPYWVPINMGDGFIYLGEL